MNNKYLLTKVMLFGLFSSSLLSANIANAQSYYTSETDQIIGETNALIQEASQFLDQQQQRNDQEMNYLHNSCLAGNQQACLEFKVRANAEARAIDDYIQTQENRRLCGSPVC